MLDPVVHAALVVVFAYLVKLGFNAVGIEVGEDVYTSLAGVIVSYILSLFGLSLLRKADKSNKVFGADHEYHPPFT